MARQRKPVITLIGIGLGMMTLAVVTEMISFKILQNPSLPHLAGLAIVLACGGYLTIKGARNSKHNEMVGRS